MEIESGTLVIAFSSAFVLAAAFWIIHKITRL
jgi:hypothetical protein